MAGITFSEVLKGILHGDDSVPAELDTWLQLTVSIADLDVFLRDPQHSADLNGAVYVEGMTPGAVPLRDGVIRINALAKGQRGRIMTYQLSFTDASGFGWNLSGLKEVCAGRGGPWRATTRLEVDLWPSDERATARLRGTLAISPVEVLRLLASLRPTGGGLFAVIRFSAFFGSSVLRAIYGMEGKGGV